MGIMSDSDNDASGSDVKKSEEELTKELEDKCQEAFMAFDKEGNGYVKSDQIKAVLELMAVNIEEDDVFRLLADIDPNNTGIITFADFKVRVVGQEVRKLRGSDSAELLDAFVALGGDEDGGGCVDAQKLIDTIKHEF